MEQEVRDMANQNPQPEVYTTRHVFGDNAAVISAGTRVTQTVYTNQANNEEVRIYGIMAEIMAGGTGAAGGAFNGSNGPVCCSCDAIDTAPTCMDFNITLLVGANAVPSQSFSIESIACKDDKTLTFPVPVLVLFQQPLSVVITNNTQCIAGTNRTIKISLIGELAIQSADCVDPSLIQG